MRRSLHYLTAAALAALGGAAVDGATNPLFADGAVCSSGTTSVCMVTEVCTDYGWNLSFTPPSLGQTCLAKTTKTYYWSSSTTTTTETTKIIPTKQ